MRAMAKEGSREQESAKVEDPKKTSPAVENPLAQGRGGVHARMSNAAAQDRLRELTGAATEKGGEEENGKSGPEGDAGGITTAGPPPAAPPAAKPADSKPDVDATAKVEAKTAVEADPKPADGKAAISPWYLRFEVLDVPGVLASIAGNLAEAGVSIESMIQRVRAPGAPVAIVMITHET